MKPESRNSSLLDNGSLDMFPQQQINLWKPKRCYEININSLSKDMQQRFSVVTGDYISDRVGKNVFILRSSFVLNDWQVRRHSSFRVQ
jgi:hypothetical protein